MFELFFGRAENSLLPTRRLARQIYLLIKKYQQFNLEGQKSEAKKVVNEGVDSGYVETVEKGIEDWQKLNNRAVELDSKTETKIILFLLRVEMDYEENKRNFEKLYKELRAFFRNDPETLRYIDAISKKFDEEHNLLKEKVLEAGRILRDERDNNQRLRSQMHGFVMKDFQDKLKARDLRPEYKNDRKLSERVRKDEDKIIRSIETIRKHSQTPSLEEINDIRDAIKHLYQEVQKENSLFKDMIEDARFVIQMAVVYFFTIMTSQEEFDGTLDSIAKLRFPQSKMSHFIKEKQKYHDAIDKIGRKQMRSAYQLLQRIEHA